MAKIPEATINLIQQKVDVIERITEEIRNLTYYVNLDSLDWNGINIPISESSRQVMVNRYEELKTELATEQNALP